MTTTTLHEARVFMPSRASKLLLRSRQLLSLAVKRGERASERRKKVSAHQVNMSHEWSVERQPLRPSPAFIAPRHRVELSLSLSIHALSPSLYAVQPPRPAITDHLLFAGASLNIYSHLRVHLFICTQITQALKSSSGKLSVCKWAADSSSFNESVNAFCSLSWHVSLSLSLSLVLQSKRSI